jgi:hypothetical protein
VSEGSLAPLSSDQQSQAKAAGTGDQYRIPVSSPGRACYVSYHGCLAWRQNLNRPPVAGGFQRSGGSHRAIMQGEVYAEHSWGDIHSNFHLLYARAGRCAIGEAYNRCQPSAGVGTWCFIRSESSASNEFLEIATCAGRKLGVPSHLDPVSGWMDAVVKFLAENQPSLLAGLHDGEGAVADPLLASEMLSALLSKLEQTAQCGYLESPKAPRPTGSSIPHGYLSRPHPSPPSPNLNRATNGSGMHNQQREANLGSALESPMSNVVQLSESPEKRRATEPRTTSRGYSRRECKRKEYPHKGDTSLLAGKHAVSFAKAEQYSAKTQRWLRQLAADASLETEGRGPDRKVLVHSLLSRFPPEQEIEGSRRK